MAQCQPSLLRHCKEHPQGPPYLAAVENPFPFLQTENLFSFLSLYKDHHLTKRACWLFWRWLSKALASVTARNILVSKEAVPDNKVKPTLPHDSNAYSCPLGLACNGAQESGQEYEQQLLQRTRSPESTTEKQSFPCPSFLHFTVALSWAPTFACSSSQAHRQLELPSDRWCHQTEFGCNVLHGACCFQMFGLLCGLRSQFCSSLYKQRLPKALAHSFAPWSTSRFVWQSTNAVWVTIGNHWLVDKSLTKDVAFIKCSEKTVLLIK